MTEVSGRQDLELFERQAKKFSLIPLDGKRPIEARWQMWCGTKRDFERKNFEGRNAGVCCGSASGVFVLDVDDPTAFEAFLKGNGFDIPDTYTVMTGSGKPHYYFKYPDGGETVGNKSIKHPLYSGHTICDIRGHGGQVVAAGSVHPDTQRLYQIEKRIEIATAPAWLRDLLSDGEINMDALLEVPLPTPKDREFVESLQVSQNTKRLILEGVPKPQRSEAGMKVILALLGAGHVEDIVWFILNNYAIGEKYREKGTARAKWLRGEITRARGHLATEQNTSGRQGNAQPEQPEIEEIVQELNQKHAVIMMSGKCMIMNEIYDQQFERPDITFSRPSDIKLYYANQKVLILEGGSHRLVNKAKIWLEAPNRREYQGVIFDPQGDIPGYYNLFRGLAVESKQGDWSLFRRHIMEVIANGDEAITKYILAWMAHLVQQPGGERPGTALVLRGKQGTGKGCFVAQFGKIFGSHFIHVSSQRQITGRFNGHLKDALLVFCDEGIWAGDKTSEGVLKAMITEDRNLIEPKGKEVYSVKNHMRLIVASNNDWVIPAGFEERRFCVLDISDKYMQDRDYFRSIFEQMDNGGREAMLYDLLHYDISGIDLKTFPRTQALMDQIFSSMTPVQKFWYERLNEGSLIEHHDEWKSFIPIEELYGEYIQFAENIGGRYQVTSTKFGKEIRKLCPQVIKKKMKANHSGDGRKSHYHFPTLIECRKSFEKLVKMELQWDLET